MVDVPRQVGTFRANVTRDAEAVRRSGHAFYQSRKLPESKPSDEGQLYEILFGDGLWMLAREQDLEFPP